jgi:hypothetical protein
MGPEGAGDWFMGTLEAEFGDIDWAVARLDLYADFQRWPLTVADRGRFVCRARRVWTYDDGGILTGFTFGKRSAGTVVARIYDKTQKVREDGSDWWYEVWGSAFDPRLPVWRVEFEFHREALAELGVRTPQDALNGTPALWSYATSQWLTHREPTGDDTRARWPVSLAWQRIAEALFGAQTVPAERIAAGARAGSLRRILPALRGYAASCGALLGTEDLENTLGGLRELLLLDEERTGYPFSLRIQQKRSEQVAT